MKKSVKIRKIIFEILYEIHIKSINFEESFTKFTKNISINDQERSMIYNVALNSIRNNFFIQSILNKYLQKRTSIKIKILLLSAITQVLYLDFKSYAVTNDTVELAKIKKLNPSLINALLKNIIIDRNKISKEKIFKSSIPLWFSCALQNNKIDVNKLIKNMSYEPSLHLVFKNENLLKKFNEKYIKTTKTSAFLIEKKKITEIDKYGNGYWWVQDFSSMLPIYLSPEIRFKKILDMCSAPGGKAFQALSMENNVILNDINNKRIIKLKNNLTRLNFNKNVLNLNGLNISEKQKFDVVILDSPCSGVGTIRRNPEIIFKKNSPNLNNLVKLQMNLINKAAKLLKSKGILIYMVCSFLNNETKAIKKKFLKENQDFSQSKFKLHNQKEFNEFIDSEGDIFCLPNSFKNHMIDGFYGVKFIKNG